MREYAHIRALCVCVCVSGHTFTALTAPLRAFIGLFSLLDFLTLSESGALNGNAFNSICYTTLHGSVCKLLGSLNA